MVKTLERQSAKLGESMEIVLVSKDGQIKDHRKIVGNKEVDIMRLEKMLLRKIQLILGR